MAEGIRQGYAQLRSTNEYFHALDDKGLKALIVQVTGGEPESSAVRQIYGTLSILKQFADFEASIPDADSRDGHNTTDLSLAQVKPDHFGKESASVGMNLSYTINLNLPATPDQAVFNSIFRSLREHLLQ